MKKLIFIVVLLLIVLVKNLIPANAALARQIVSFLGLEQAAVQALGRSLIEVSH